jgi:DNA gyrase/topoisomerase IV subunit A
MKLRALTNLDSKELATEETEMLARIEELKELVSNDKVRKAYMLKEIKAIGVRHGEKRRSEIIDPPESLHVEKGSTRVATPVAKPRFLKVDAKKGTIEQVKGPRGALVLDRTDKLIAILADGTLKKLSSSFKGAIGESYSEVLLAKKETEVATRKYLLVFTLGDQLKAMAIDGEALTKTTSKGKRLVPENATVIHFGEGAYEVPWVSARKKKVELFPVTAKAGKPGGHGSKVASLSEVKL